MSLDNIIGVPEAARILGLADSTVKNMCADGKLLAKKIGKTWVLDKIMIEAEKKKKEEISAYIDHVMNLGK